MTGTMVLMMLKDYATFDALSLIEWLDDLKGTFRVLLLNSDRCYKSTIICHI